MAELIRVLIADDHHVVRRGLAGFLVARNKMIVVGEAANGREAVELARTLRPDVIVIDMLMPELTGLEAIAAIRRDDPRVRILVVASFSERADVVAAIQAGALGYMRKDALPRELLQAIRNVHQGVLTLPQDLVVALTQPLPPAPGLDELTERELAVLHLLAEGRANHAIALTLMISDATVRSHVSSILAKLKVANRTQAALVAREHLKLQHTDRF
jgi:DNA-binding NarL/FixJ family response regulator